MTRLNAQRIKPCQRKTHYAPMYALSMEEIHDRLRAARMQAGYETSSDAARAFGWTISTYAGHENGSRGIRQEAAQRYASAFNVSVEWLTYGTGTPTSRPTAKRSAIPGFGEPAAEPLKPSSALSVRSFQKKTSEESRTDAAPFQVSRDFPHLGIQAGDVIFVNLKAPARNGDIVLANYVDPITASATTLIRRLVGNSLVGSASEPIVDLSSDISVSGPIDGLTRVFNAR
ncbi:helix-turn-helix domain-containing protein [Mameliella sp. AT18]|nr:helix-turn-helix domain-containing protein [Mameliella sp. AT18]